MKEVLITGGTGFIGTSLVIKLKNKYKITILDLPRNIRKRQKFKHVKYISGDMSKAKTFDKIKKEFFKVFHLAAATSSSESEIKNRYYLNSNVISIMNLCNWAKKYKPKYIIFSSSMAVYGKEINYLNEKTECNPCSFYGVAKLFGEKMLLNLSSYGIKILILRLFNVYGPGQDLKNLNQGMLSIYLAQLINSNKIEVTGTKNRYRDFIYIDDVLNALVINPKEKIEIFNVGTGKKSTVSEIIKLLVLGLKKNMNEIKINYSKNKSFDVFGSVANITKIQNRGWRPKNSLKIGISKVLKSL
jgi:UDP-glucose 4-epimerase